MALSIKALTLRGCMIVRSCPLFMMIITKIERLILDQKTQHPDLTDEEIIEILKNKLREK